MYVLNSAGDYRMDITRSGDNFVGCCLPVDYNVDCRGVELFISEYLEGDVVSIETCTLWAVMVNSDFKNCCVRVICLRKLMWKSLKKQRHSSDCIASVLRQLFWWCVLNNVKLNIENQKLDTLSP